MEYEYEDIVNRDNTFKYQMLSRLKMDCEYYLGYSNRNAKHLWSNNEKSQIELMKRIWSSFLPSEKPEWLSFAKIEEYESKMVNYVEELENEM